jgi:hypothetical protein
VVSIGFLQVYLILALSFLSLLRDLFPVFEKKSNLNFAPFQNLHRNQNCSNSNFSKEPNFLKFKICSETKFAQIQFFPRFKKNHELNLFKNQISFTNQICSEFKVSSKAFMRHVLSF